MTSNFYWIKVGMLIGFGLIIGACLTILFLPYSIYLGLIFIAACVIIMLIGAGARYAGRIAARHKLQQGWADRAHR